MGTTKPTTGKVVVPEVLPVVVIVAERMVFEAVAASSTLSSYTLIKQPVAVEVTMLAENEIKSCGTAPKTVEPFAGVVMVKFGAPYWNRTVNAGNTWNQIHTHTHTCIIIQRTSHLGERNCNERTSSLLVWKVLAGTLTV